MAREQELQTSLQFMLTCIDNLKEELEELRHARERARFARVEFANPDAFDLLVLYVSEMSELALRQSINMKVSDELKQRLTAIECLAPTLTAPRVTRAR